MTNIYIFMNAPTDLCWISDASQRHHDCLLNWDVEFQHVLFFSTLFIYSASLISLNPLQYVQTVIRWQPCLSTVPSSPCPCFSACLSLLSCAFCADLTKTLPYIHIRAYCLSNIFYWIVIFLLIWENCFILLILWKSF